MKEREKALKADKKAAEKAQKLSVNQGATGAKLSRSSTRTNTEIAALEKQELGASAESQAKEKPKKDRKFCILLSKGLNGERDPAWIRVYMEGVDEVGAHRGLFFSNKPHYEKLVSDVGAKIQEWVERGDFVREARGA